MTEPFVHPTAVIDDGVQLGDGVKVWHFAHVSRDARIGARCILGQNVFIGPGVAIGDGVKIQNNVSVYAGVELADDVFLGPSCVFTNVLTPRAHVERKNEFSVTRVGRGATVGANATIVCGNDLGEFCLVGAGSVVTRSVVPHSVVAGNPAQHRGWVCQCGEILRETGDVSCARCNERYQVSETSCSRKSIDE